MRSGDRTFGIALGRTPYLAQECVLAGFICALSIRMWAVLTTHILALILILILILTHPNPLTIIMFVFSFNLRYSPPRDLFPLSSQHSPWLCKLTSFLNNETPVSDSAMLICIE